LQTTGQSHIAHQTEQLKIKNKSNSPEVIQSIATGEIDELKGIITQQIIGKFELFQYVATARAPHR
jgi:hypothetical protein